MKSFAVFAFLIGLMATLTGCLSFSRQPFDRSANASMKKIALLQVHEPPKMSVINLGGASGAFGLIGAAVEIAEQERKSQGFTQAMTAQKALVGQQLTQTIEARLKKQGYDVTVLSDRPGVIDPDAPTDKEVDYSRIRTDADAVLHVWFGAVGYLSPVGSTDYSPNVWVAARLVDMKRKPPLYFQSFAYQTGNTTENVEKIQPSSQYAYGDFESLMTQSTAAAQGIKDGVGEIGIRIANDLRKSDAPPESASPVAAGPPPESAAGFALGSDVAAAEARCTGASFAWQKLNDMQFSCSGAPVDVGVPAMVTLTTCEGLVCKVAVNGSADGAAWSALTERFDKLSKLLEGSHGNQAERQAERLKDCIHECFAAGRVRRSVLWRWPSKQGVSLVLWGGPVGGPPELRVYYYSPAYIEAKVKSEQQL